MPGFYPYGKYLRTTSCVSYKVVLSGSLNYRGLICRIQKSFWKFGKYSKRLSMSKSNFEKADASRTVSREILVISEDSSVWGQLYLEVAAHEFFSCVLWTMRLFSFVYIATPKIFIILSAFLSHWKLCYLLFFLKKCEILESVCQIDANVPGFCRGIIRK